MYYPFIESLASFLVDIPLTFVTIAFFCILLYFIVQLQQTAAQFFIFFLFVCWSLMLLLNGTDFPPILGIYCSSCNEGILQVFGGRLFIRSTCSVCWGYIFTGSRNLQLSCSFVFCLIVRLFLTAGYSLPIPSMIGALKWISYINVSSCDPFFVSDSKASLAASSLRLRGSDGQRVSHDPRTMFAARSIWSWLRRHHACQSNLYDNGSYSWAAYG
jgi:hypothetical protein